MTSPPRHRRRRRKPRYADAVILAAGVLFLTVMVAAVVLPGVIGR